MIRVEYFLKKMAEREAALIASPASGQDGAARQLRANSGRSLKRINFMPLEPPVGEFNLSRLERVIYGPGKIAADGDACSGSRHRVRLYPYTAELACSQSQTSKPGSGRRQHRRPFAGRFLGKKKNRTTDRAHLLGEGPLLD
jgi:hypothetical protein